MSLSADEQALWTAVEAQPGGSPFGPGGPRPMLQRLTYPASDPSAVLIACRGTRRWRATSAKSWPVVPWDGDKARRFSHHRNANAGPKNS
jgi:hypothetical protein